MKDKIVLIDSGVGGFSILKGLLGTDLNFHAIYLADQKYFPYGNKSNEWIKERILKIVSWAKNFNPTCIVIACNTATSQSISLARSITNIPIIGLDPVVKPLSSYDSPLLLATKGTLSSNRLKELLNGKKIDMYSPSLLTSAIEDMDEEKIIKEVNKLNKSFNPDAIGLSCTHYPLASDIFSSIFKGVDLIDPSIAVVKQIKKYISDNMSTRVIDWYTTGQMVRLRNQINKYLYIEATPLKTNI